MVTILSIDSMRKIQQIYRTIRSSASIMIAFVGISVNRRSPVYCMNWGNCMHALYNVCIISRLTEY